MKKIVNTFLFLYLSLNYTDCHQSSSGSSATTYGHQLRLIDDDDQCPLWHLLNPTTNLCECYDFNDDRVRNVVKCIEQGIGLRVGHCMTYDEWERTIYIGPCDFGGNFSTNDNGRYVELPVKNISELNYYMCDPMNRKGRLCSECIEGFGPSVISSGLVCSNCMGAWYGIPLYIFLEFIPITIFFVTILFFRVNITSAPMVAFVFFSQVIVATFLNYGIWLKFAHPTAYVLILIMVTFYGFWNLDFFRYILPPFCVSSELKRVHIVLIDYISAFYPLCLICITWIIIELHFHNIKPVVWLWSKISKCSCIRNRSIRQRNSLIDVFATFFLLSYTKLVYTSSRILFPLNVMAYTNNTLSNTRRFAEADARIEYFGKEHALYALIAILIIPFIIAPPVFLIVYPIKVVRSLLFKCRLSTRTIASLNIFVEKYYSCYRDGTGGGRDMRSLASMYFILRVIAILIFQVTTSLNTSLTFAVVLYAGYGTVIALVRPYKKTYMNIIDTLIIENLALLALMVLKYNTEESNSFLSLFYAVILSIFSFLPLLGLIVFIAYGIFKRIRRLSELYHTEQHAANSNKPKAGHGTIRQDQHSIDNSDQELPDRMLHPQEYDIIEMNGFEHVNYVRASDSLQEN